MYGLELHHSSITTFSATMSRLPLHLRPRHQLGMLEALSLRDPSFPPIPLLLLSPLGMPLLPLAKATSASSPSPTSAPGALECDGS